MTDVTAESGSIQDIIPPAIEPSGWLAATFDSFRFPAYRLLWLNSALMLTAAHLTFTAQSVVAFDVTGNNRAVGFVAFAQGLGLLLTTPVAGVVADRLSKRLLLGATELLLGLMAVALSALIFTDSITIFFVAAGAFCFGCSLSFFWPAQTAFMGDIVEPDYRGNAAALFQVCLNLTRSFAPFVAAGLLAWDRVGAGGTYLVVSLIFAPALITVALLPATLARTRTDGRIWQEIRLGVEHVRENRRLLEAMVSFIIVTLLGFSIMVVLPALTKDVLDAGDAGFGIMFGVNAIGALAASLVAASLASSKRLPLFLTLTSVAFGLTIACTGLMPTFPLALVAMLLVGAAGGGFQTLVTAVMLRTAQPVYLGRVMSLTTIAWSLTNLAGLLVGLLADLFSERAVLVGVGLTLALVALVLTLWSKASAGSRFQAAES